MPRRIERKERGVFEKEPGSGIWWIRYKINGVERREKVGRRGDAIKLYSLRKADALRGVKLPKKMKLKGIRFKVIAQEAVTWYESHDRKDVRNFKSRMSLILESLATVSPMRSSPRRLTLGLERMSGARPLRTATRMSSARHSRLRSRTEQ